MYSSDRVGSERHSCQPVDLSDLGCPCYAAPHQHLANQLRRPGRRPAFTDHGPVPTHPSLYTERPDQLHSLHDHAQRDVEQHALPDRYINDNAYRQFLVSAHVNPELITDGRLTYLPERIPGDTLTIASFRQATRKARKTKPLWSAHRVYWLKRVILLINPDPARFWN
jgi:hypothetical protein